MNETALAVMVKQPRVGETKTRLCPPLSFRQAAGLYEALMLDSLALAASLPGVDPAAALSPPQARPYFAAAAPAGTRLLPVEGRDIGECLAQAVERLLGLGYRRALAMNSDGPTLPPEYLLQAIRSLDEHDVVVGPGHDGGYYVIGMKRFHPGVFQDIEWSTERVLAQTLERAAGLGLRAVQTPVWYDIDTPDDLARLEADLARLDPGRLAHTRRFLADFEGFPGRSPGQSPEQPAGQP